MRIVAGRAALGGGLVGTVSFDQCLHVTMAGKAQLGFGSAEQIFLGRQVWLMALDAAPVFDRSVNRAKADILFEIGMARKTQLCPLDGKPDFRAAGLSVATLTRPVCKGRMDL